MSGAYASRFPVLSQLAGRLGLQLRETHVDVPGHREPLISVWGLVDGLPVAIQRFSSFGSPRHVIRVARVPPLDMGLFVRPQGALKRHVLDLVRVDDHLTGDADFDRAFRVGADDGERARALLTDAMREALTELDAVSARNGSVDDAFVVVDGDLEWLGDCVDAAIKVAQQMRAAAQSVQIAPQLDAWQLELRSLAAAYGLRCWATPLSAEGAVSGLETGLAFRRSGRGEYGFEIGCVVDPAMRYDLEIVPRKPRWELEAPELMIPIHPLREISAQGMPLESRFEVHVAPTSVGDVEAVVPRAAQIAMARLSGRFDVVFRYGILTLRQAVAGLEPRALRLAFDEAIDGARTIVPALREGYRSAGRR